MGLAESIAAGSQRLSRKVYINGRSVETTREGCDYGYDSITAALSVELAEKHDWIRNGQMLEVHLGYDGFLQSVGKCQIVEWQPEYWPYRKTVQALGPLHKAMQPGTAETIWTVEANKTDTQIVSECLDLKGLSQRDLQGAGTIIPILDDVTLPDGEAPWAVIAEVDKVTGWKTFESPPGTMILRRAITPGKPAATPVATYTEGVDNVRFSRPVSIRDAANRVRVEGLTGEDIISIRREDSALISPDVTHKDQSDLCQSQSLADAWSAREMIEHNRQAELCELVIPGDPRRRPGETVAVVSAQNELGSATNYVIRHLAHSREGALFQTRLLLDGGLGSAGYLESQPPFADFDYKLVLENVEIAGTATNIYTALCKATAFDPDTPPELLTFAWASSPATVAGTAWDYATYFTQAQMGAGTAPTVSLTVTDETALSDSVTKSITTDDDLHPVTIRELYVAARAKAYALTGGTAWNSWTPAGGALALSTPEIAGESMSLFGLDSGGIARTTDRLATGGSILTTRAAAVNALWLHEIDANRVSAGLADGKVDRTADLSAGTAATWATLKTYPDPVNWVIETYTGQHWIATNNQIRVSNDLLKSDYVLITLDPGGTARHIALSPFANYGAGGIVKREDGVTITGGSAVRWITHHPRDDILLAGEPAGSDCLVLRKPAGGTAFAACGTIVGSGQPNHALRDGDNPGEFYAACDNGLYKSWDTGETWYRMLATNGTTEKCLQVGYGSTPWAPFTPTTVVSETTALNPLIKCYQLGSEPSGWKDVGFDDSGWAAALEREGGQHPFDPSVYRIWYTQVPTAGDAALFRHKFTLPDGVITSATLYYNVDDVVVGFWINGVSVVASNVPAPDGSITISPTLLLPGSDNIIAIHVQNNAPAWAHIAYMLVIT